MSRKLARSLCETSHSPVYMKLQLLVFDTLEIDQGLGMKISGEHRSEELARGCKDELVGRDLLVPLADQGDIREVGVRKEMFQGVWSAGSELVP